MLKLVLVILSVVTLSTGCLCVAGADNYFHYPDHLCLKFNDQSIVEFLNAQGCLGVVHTECDDPVVIKNLADGYGGFSVFEFPASIFKCHWQEAEPVFRWYAPPSGTTDPEKLVYEDLTERCTVQRSYLYFPWWIPMALFGFYPAYKIYRGPILRSYRRVHGLCPRCGYSLKGNVSGVCSECGADVSGEMMDDQ